MRRRRWIAAAAVLALSFAVPQFTASAASNGSTSFLPTSTQKDQLRPYFVYTLAPGATIQDTGVLENDTNKTVSFDLYPADATDVDGAFAIMGRSATRKDVGAWVTLPGKSIKVPAKSKKVISLTLTVPANATPGDHAGGVVALGQQIEKGRAGGQVQIGARYGVGVRIYLRVAGPAHAGLTVTNFHLATPKGLTGALFGPAKASVTYSVENTGNLRLSPSSDVSVSTRAKSIREPRIALGEMLPGSKITKTVKVDGLRWSSLLGVVHAKVSITAQGAPATTSSITAYTLPWLSLLILVALIVFCIVFRRIRRARKRRSESEPEPPAESPTDELVDA
jgi:hypothetical protein